MNGFWVLVLMPIILLVLYGIIEVFRILFAMICERFWFGVATIICIICVVVGIIGLTLTGTFG